MENFNPTLPMAPGGPFNVPFVPGNRFTVAQLMAMSSGESARMLVAFCSDCITSNETPSALSGDMVYWTGNQWLTSGDRVPPTTDFLTFALSVARLSPEPRMTPFVSVSGDTANPLNALNGFVSGTSASYGGFNNAPTTLLATTASPGTTSTGSFKGFPIYSVQSSFSNPVRSQAVIMSLVPASAALSNVGVDNWHWRLAIQTPAFSSAATLNADDMGFVMDDANTLGLGATGTELYALCRLNSSTLDWVATGINPATTAKFLIVTWEPTGPGVREGRCRVASADDFGANLTTHVDRSGSFSTGTALLGCINGAKTLGTGSRFFARRFLTAVTLRTSSSSGTVIS